MALWRRNVRITLALLLLWFLASFGIAFFARELSFTVMGGPFSFWMASQGTLLVFCLIIWAYARAMDKLDAEADQAD